MSTAALRSLLAVAACCAVTAAQAHPHVWVSARAQVAYADGKVTGVRHTWSFDPEYSAYVTQGLDANKDGKLSPTSWPPSRPRTPRTSRSSATSRS